MHQLLFLCYFDLQRLKVLKKVRKKSWHVFSTDRFKSHACKVKMSSTSTFFVIAYAIKEILCSHVRLRS